MSFRHSNAVREIGIDRFDSHTQRYILIEAAHLSDSSGILRYSHNDLANAIGLSRITVAKEINLLEGKGLVIKEKHGQYKIDIPLSKLPVSTNKGAMPTVVEVEEEPAVSAFDIWWEDSPLIKVDSGGNEIVFVVMDEIPKDVQQYADAGMLTQRPGLNTLPGAKDVYLIYDRA